MYAWARLNCNLHTTHYFVVVLKPMFLCAVRVEYCGNDGALICQAFEEKDRLRGQTGAGDKSRQ